METLKERVRAALAAAAENGGYADDWTPDNIAFDMVSFDADLEHEEVDDVAAVVAELVAEQKGAGEETCTCAALPEPPDDSCPVHGGEPA